MKGHGTATGLSTPQFRELTAAVVRQLPQDLDAKTAQFWIEEQGELANALKLGLSRGPGRKKAMISVCGKFGDQYWVWDVLLTCVAELSNVLAKEGVDVVYSCSMDNAQMSNPVKGVECEAFFAKEREVDFHFVIFQDQERQNSLFLMFKRLRELLPKSVKLVAVDLYHYNNGGLNPEEKNVLMAQLGIHTMGGWRRELALEVPAIVKA